MKFLIIVLIVAPAVLAKGQSPSGFQNTSAIKVIKFNWSKERLGWESDPFRGPVENFDEMRTRARNEKRIEDAKRGNPSEVDKIKGEARADAANTARQHQNTRSRYVFLYKVTLKNASVKSIKSVDWDYVFLDANTGNEINRQQFTSEEKIGPGKTSELKVLLNRSPTRTISADALNNKEREGLSEQVVIVRVEYADGSVWQHP
jgi:hypothetical protein